MMHFQCSFGRHEAAPGEVRNQGFGFSRCRGCGCDLVRSSREWRTVPKGFRVAWRRTASRQTELYAGQLLFDLPVKGRALTLVTIGKRSTLSCLIELLIAGLRYFAGAAARRLGAWQRALLMPRRAPLPRLALAARAGAPATGGATSLRSSC